MPISPAFPHSTPSASADGVLNSVDTLLQQQDFFQHVDLWAKELAPDQEREIAAARIKAAYEKKSTELSLKNLDLSSLPMQIGMLTSLITIDVSENRLATLPESIGQLKKLEALHAQSNCLTTLPESLCELQALQVLIVRDNSLIALPNNLGQLNYLEILDVSTNTLSTLPESIGNLKALGGLHVNDNQLKILPDEVSQLTTLVVLNANVNQIEKLPENIGQLKNLEELYAQSNRLTSLPESLYELQALKILKLCNNNLTDLLKKIDQLNCLEILDVRRNALSTLPESLGNLKALRELHVSYNLLTSLPNEVSQLTTLVVLNASANQINWVPSNIGDMPNLKRLDLQDNRLFSVLFSLEHIDEVYLEDNPALDVLTASHRLINFGAGLEKTISYLQQACNYSSVFEGWGIQNSCFINQLLQHAGRLQEQVQSRAMDNTVGVHVQRLRSVYFEIREVAALVQQARDIDFLYDSAREDLVFMSRDGRAGIIMGKDFYRANILGLAHPTDISWIRFSSYIFDEKKQAYTNVPIGDITKTLQPFPFLQYKFLAENQFGTLKNFFAQLNLGVYKELFIGALSGRTNTIRLIAFEHQTALIDLFSPMIHHENDEIRITDAHLQTILNVFPIATREPAGTLFGLAMLMTRYSSQAVFGAESESPVALRHYALALLNKAMQINPNLMNAQCVQNYRDSLLQRNDAQGCTEQLFTQMFSDARGLINAGNHELETVINAVVPSIWR